MNINSPELDALMGRFRDLKNRPPSKTKTITRYKLVDGNLIEDEEGDIVKYDDYMIEVEKWKARMHTAYNDGRNDGKDSGYSWRL